MIVALALIWIALLPNGFALTADEIIDSAQDAQQVDNAIQKIEMVLVSKSGSKRVRRLEMRTRTDGEMVRSYIRFSHPTDIAGTQLVVVDSPKAVDEQILYLPALKRTNRIAGKARSGSFMGSDFAYEDLEFSSEEDAVHTLVSEDDTTWVIDTVPGAASSYSSIRAHVAKADYLPRKVEFFKKGAPLKVLEISETTRQGDTIIPKHSVMTNLQKGTKTELSVIEVRLNIPASEIPDETFTAGYLERNG